MKNKVVTSEEKTVRNKRIYDLWLSGKFSSMAAIARQYKLSRARVSSIIKAQIKKNGGNGK